MVLLVASFWPLVNKAPISASMAEAIRLRMMEHSMYSGPLRSGNAVDVLVRSCGW